MIRSIITLEGDKAKYVLAKYVKGEGLKGSKPYHAVRSTCTKSLNYFKGVTYMAYILFFNGKQSECDCPITDQYRIWGMAICRVVQKDKMETIHQKAEGFSGML